ncbi:MAG: CoA-binding protein [Bacteroidota bacterium]
MKKTAVIGASPNPARYSFMASEMLSEYGHEIVPLGIRRGKVAEEEIVDIRNRPDFDDIDTITLYIGPKHQPQWYDYILSLNPKRIIFNPGTENYELQQMAEEKGIEIVEGCTLVMLRVGNY